MVDLMPTAFIFFGAAIALLALPRGPLRGALLLAVPLVAAYQVWSLPLGSFAQVPFFDFDLDVMRVDKLSRVFGLIFCLAAFLGNLYAWHVRDTVQQVAALLYAGAAIGAVFAGDLITLFFYWEGTAIASVFLIWARRTQGAYAAGMRYLIVQIGSGVILLAGVALHYQDTGSIAFDQMTLGSVATWLIFISFGIKCAFPLLHNWLHDSYPAATITGTVILSAFTTKMAVYALARGFAGTEILIYIGAIMAVFPILFAIVENDLRRVLSYALNSQLGFMVVGIGVGTEMALNGTVSHAVASILYKALLFMSIGAVMLRTGTAKASELGGLYRTMPVTAIFCLIGAATISAFPLLSGFVTKSLIIDAAAEAHYPIIWGALYLASAGVVAHTGIKVPYAAFFGQDRGLRPAEAPANMLWAMGLTAFFCVAIGIYPEPLYALLPFPAEFHPYTTGHVVGQLQLLCFALLAFGVLTRTGIYPSEIRAINLDTDWTYRRMMPSVIAAVARAIAWLWSSATNAVVGTIRNIIARVQYSQGPEGQMAQNWPTGAMVLWIAILLGITLVLIFVS